MIRNQEPDFQLLEDVDPEVTKLVKQCLKKNPDARPSAAYLLKSSELLKNVGQTRAECDNKIVMKESFRKAGARKLL